MTNSGNVKEKLEVSRIWRKYDDSREVFNKIVNAWSEDVTPSEGPGNWCFIMSVL